MNIIIALDKITLSQAVSFINKTHDLVYGYKVNDLLIEHGVVCIDIFKKIKAKNIFADPKLFDIPNTVKNSVRRLVNAGADLITVHSLGGKEMIEAATEVSDKILTVTLPTSYDDNECLRLFNQDRYTMVKNLAELGCLCKALGVVLSGDDLSTISHIDKKYIRVVPGFRPKKIANDDQKHITNHIPDADFVVVGRPILEAENPIQELVDLCKILQNS